MRKFFYILIALFVIGLTACDDSSSSSTTPSSVAQLTAFAFAANDSMPGLGAAVFTVEERLDSGLVWNKDSILYGTRLDSVVPRFTYAATPDAAWLTLPDTTCALTGYDTLDFTKGPIYLSIRSADKANTKTYEIRATVHQIDPDLYNWTRLTPSMYAPGDPHATGDLEQQIVELGTDFVLLSSNGFTLRAYRSPDGENWTHTGVPAGLPAGTNVRRIISSADSLYYAQDNTVYTSADALTWKKHTVPQNVITALMYWNRQIWLLVEDAQGYELATWQNGQVVPTQLRPNRPFPVSDYATVCFRNPSLRERAVIIGGFAEDGTALHTLWNLEYSGHTPENNGYRMQEFSVDRSISGGLTGASVVAYNNQLLMFGGVDENSNLMGRDIFISYNEGLSWTVADTTKNRLPEGYQARQKQTAVVRDNCIYVFGGQDGSNTYRDVYKGRLNSIDWNK